MFFFIVVSSLLGIGCDRDFVKPLQVAAVTGEVTLDGDPVSDANIVFIPLNVRKGKKDVPFAYGTTDAKGNFELTMSDGRKGAFVGKYSVVVSKLKSNPISATSPRATEGKADPATPPSPKDRQLDLEKQQELIRLRASAFVKAMPATDRFFNATQDVNELIPSLYNRHSILVREVRSIEGLSEPKFDLRTVDPLLIDD